MKAVSVLRSLGQAHRVLMLGICVLFKCLWLTHYFCVSFIRMVLFYLLPILPCFHPYWDDSDVWGSFGQTDFSLLCRKVISFMRNLHIKIFLVHKKSLCVKQSSPACLTGWTTVCTGSKSKPQAKYHFVLPCRAKKPSSDGNADLCIPSVLVRHPNQPRPCS